MLRPGSVGVKVMVKVVSSPSSSVAGRIGRVTQAVGVTGHRNCADIAFKVAGVSDSNGDCSFLVQLGLGELECSAVSDERLVALSQQLEADRVVRDDTR